MATDNKIKYAITSNSKYEKIALPRLLNSLFENGIEREDIIISISGKKNSVEIKDGIYTIYTTEDAFDFGAFKEVCKRELESDFWFFMPDTSMAGKNFKHLVETKSDFSANVNVPYYQGIGNIGLFKMSYILSKKELFRQIKNIPTYIASVTEGFCWLTAKRLPEDKNTDCVYYPNHGFDLEQPSDIYGNGTLRVAHYLSCIDFTKYMSHFDTEESMFDYKNNL